MTILWTSPVSSARIALWRLPNVRSPRCPAGRASDKIPGGQSISELIESRTKLQGVAKVGVDIRMQRGKTVLAGFLKLLLRRRR